MQCGGRQWKFRAAYLGWWHAYGDVLTTGWPDGVLCSPALLMVYVMLQRGRSRWRRMRRRSTAWASTPSMSLCWRPALLTRRCMAGPSRCLPACLPARKPNHKHVGLHDPAELFIIDVGSPESGMQARTSCLLPGVGVQRCL